MNIFGIVMAVIIIIIAISIGILMLSLLTTKDCPQCKSGRRVYNPIIEKLKQMEVERIALINRVKETRGFENEEAVKILKAHDIEVGKLLGIK